MNRTDEEIFRCLGRELSAAGEEDCQCPLVCKETKYIMRPSPGTGFEFSPYLPLYSMPNSTFWTFEIKMESNKITKVTESQAYTFEKFIAELRGYFGLFLGLSVMSLFEFLGYLIICVAIYFKMIK